MAHFEPPTHRISEEHRQLYRRLLLRGVLLLVGLVFLFAALPRLLTLFAPFVFALFVAMLLNPLVERIESRLHIKRRISAFVLTFVVVSAALFLITRLIISIVNESVSLAANINSIWSYVTTSIRFLNEKWDWLLDLLPASNEYSLDSLTENIYSWLQSASTSIMDSALTLAANTTSKVSNILLTVTVSLLAVYFTIADYPNLSRYTKNHVDRYFYQFFVKIKDAIKAALGGYLRAQLLLALLAFVIMFAALVLSGQKYALLIAIGLGIVDFLPIVGTIAVLLPWAIIEFLAGNVRKALFLLILAVGYFLLRRIVEPKIVGSQTGLHPLVALLSIYAGMKISGVWGAIFGPVVVMIAVNIYKSGIFENALADLKDLYHIARTLLLRHPED